MARASAGARRSRTDKFLDSWKVTLFAGVGLPTRRRLTPGSPLRRATRPGKKQWLCHRT